MRHGPFSELIICSHMSVTLHHVITLITFLRDSKITDDDVYIKTSEVVQCRSQVNYIVVLIVY